MPAGIGNVAGNKGGVGVALTYMDHTRLLFVNAHFQAHTHRVAGRQADYLRIKAGLFNNREEAGQYHLSRPGCVVQSSRMSMFFLSHQCLSWNEATNSGIPGYQFL